MLKVYDLLLEKINLSLFFNLLTSQLFQCFLLQPAIIILL
jgi:hypothetical protein